MNRRAPQDNQDPNDKQALVDQINVTQEEFRATIQMMTQAMMAHAQDVTNQAQTLMT